MTPPVAWLPPVAGLEPEILCSISRDADTFVRSAKSTPPSRTGLPAVDPWVEVHNGVNDVPTEASPS
jgi:hypothetical protein